MLGKLVEKELVPDESPVTSLTRNGQNRQSQLGP